jgi:hypothetical protein
MIKDDISPPMALIWGAEAIARELGTNRRRAFHLLETGEIPAKKVGGRWVAERNVLAAFFQGEAA